MCEYIILENFKMDKYIYDENNGLWYELHGDYYLPCLAIPEEEVHTIGIWGRKHRRYLREHRPIIYSDLVLSGKLYSYLADIDSQARNKLDIGSRHVSLITSDLNPEPLIVSSGHIELCAQGKNLDNIGIR